MTPWITLGRGEKVGVLGRAASWGDTPVQMSRKEACGPVDGDARRAFAPSAALALTGT